MKKKRLIIIDANSVLHRAFHALPYLTTKKGEVVNAVYGFLLVLFKAIKDFQPDFIAVCFDFHGPTFRSEKFKEYKATRAAAPSELYEQIPKLKDVLTAFNIPFFEKEGFEADDLIGTIANKAAQKQIFPEIETIILSGDKDVLQLVNKKTKVYSLRKGVKDIVLYNEAQVEKKFSLRPSQLIDFKALCGDPSDNIPGVTGIGEKTAVKLLSQFGTLENIYAKIAKIPNKLRDKLLQYKDQAFLSRELVRINKQVPIDFNLSECRWTNYDKEKAQQVLQRFEFLSLINRLPEKSKT